MEDYGGEGAVGAGSDSGEWSPQFRRGLCCLQVRFVLTAWQIQEEMKRKEMENLKSKGVAVTTLEGARELSDEYPS